MRCKRVRLLLLAIGLSAQLFCTIALPAVHGGTSAQFSVSGAVLHPGTYDLAALQALTPVSQSAGANTYTGVALWNLLNNVAGLKGNAAAKHPSLSM